MISSRCEFELVSRGYEKTIVLVHGWATDRRVFSRLDLKYNYLVALKISPFSFEKDLQEALIENSIERVSLLGYSMGGFLAKDFAVKHPQKIDELIFVSIRLKYGEEELGYVRDRLLKNRRAFLSGFYRDCFSSDINGYRVFREDVLSYYLDKMPLEGLLEGLDYLSQASMQPQELEKFEKIRFFHSQDDRIAPYEEARCVASGLPRAKFVNLHGAGHVPFFSKCSMEEFNNG